MSTRDDLATLERRRNVATRYLRGQTQWEIARAFEISQATVSKDLKAIQREWLAESVLHRAEWTARELARVDEVERNAWAAWTRSQENATTRRKKQRPDGEEVVETTKGQVGDSKFLDVVLRCVAKRCELLGLDAPKETTLVGIDIKTIVAVMPGEMPT